MNRTESATGGRPDSSTCVDYDNVEWWDTWNVISMVALLTLDVMVIVGNILVIAAVYSSPKLRSVTNFFIVSLAVADLLVGVAVLPFSATWEVFKVSAAHLASAFRRWFLLVVCCFSAASWQTAAIIRRYWAASAHNYAPEMCTLYIVSAFIFSGVQR